MNELTFFGWVSFLIQEYYPLFLIGVRNTLLVSLSGTIIGFGLGLCIAMLRSIPVDMHDSALKRTSVGLLKGALSIYIEVFRGTPMIVQSMVIYYGAINIWKHLPQPQLIAGIFIISINTAAYMAEIIRGGILSVDRGQTEGAQSIGMNHRQTMMSVVLPQAIRNIMPSVGNEFVVNIKDSSVLSVISVAELFFMGRSATGTYYRYFETFFVIALVYLVLTFIVTRILRLIEHRMEGGDSFVIHGSQTDSRSHIRVAKEDK